VTHTLFDQLMLLLVAEELVLDLPGGASVPETRFALWVMLDLPSTFRNHCPSSSESRSGSPGLLVSSLSGTAGFLMGWLGVIWKACSPELGVSFPMLNLSFSCLHVQSRASRFEAISQADSRLRHLRSSIFSGCSLLLPDCLLTQAKPLNSLFCSL
jgi:hypothetical protein